jgi:ketosteroid isomerase-like protein
MNRQEAHQLITAYVDSWKTNDPAQIVDTLATDCVVVESHGPTYRGLDVATQWIEGWLGAGNTVDRWDITSFRFDEIEQAAVFEWKFTCTADGVHYEIDGISIAKFAVGKIVALREYRTTEPPYDWTGKG